PGYGEEEEDDEEEEGQPLWRDKLKELLDSKELQGTHPAAAYLRACCLFLWCIPEVVSSSSSSSSRASDAAVPAVVVHEGTGESNRRADNSKTLPEASKVGGPTAGTAGGFAGGRGAAFGVWRATEGTAAAAAAAAAVRASSPPSRAVPTAAAAGGYAG
ncbi:unnamed protein product, partial [Ectocarpus fasciculatus]